VCAILVVLVVFQRPEVAASSPTGSEYNHALASNGGQASASGYSGSNDPGKAIDGSSSTWWESSTTTGWLAVRFPAKAYVNEVHAHFETTVYSSLSLYLDTSGNGVYESGERYWSTTTNGVTNVVVSLSSVYYALGAKITIDLKNGNAKPKISEFEAYLRGDSDGDGLTNAQEGATIYFQDIRAGGIPQGIPDDGVNASSTAVNLVPFYGEPFRALANFTVNHTRRSDLTASIGYWNGTGWVDRYAWDPGKRLLGIRITQPDPAGTYSGTVPVVAFVDHPEFTAKVAFRLDGNQVSEDSSPNGNSYEWNWTTSGDGTHTLNVTQHDAAGELGWDQVLIGVNNLPPSALWVSPASGATLSGTVTVKVTATDYWSIRDVQFYVDDALQFTDTTPDSGTNDFVWSWNTANWPNGGHTLKAVATDRKLLATTITRSVTTSNSFTVTITNPAAGSTVYGTVQVTADAFTGSGTITKVEFYVDSVLQSTDTTGPNPYTWNWDTTLFPDGDRILLAKAYRSSDSQTATHSIKVGVANGGGGCTPSPCPQSAEALLSSDASAAQTLGVLTSEWPLGEVDSGTIMTIVVDLVVPQAGASAAENASRIVRPAFPVSLFLSNLQWRLLVRDWSAGSAGNLTAFTLRFEARSDPDLVDTDGDGIGDGTEVNLWGTLPVTRDSDLDGLSEGYETTPHSLTVSVADVSSILTGITTNPALWDTDGDGLSDGQERGVVTTGQSKVIGEVGFAAGVTDAWTTVYLRNKYTSPVVIAQPPTLMDGAAGIVRIRSVTDHTFELRFQEWSASGGHGGENVSYLVLESGNHVLPDGTFVEVGTKTGVGTSYVTTTLREAFVQPPIVLAQIQTYADATAAAAKIRSVTSASFDAYLRTNPIGSHGTETVGYVGIAPQADPNVLGMWTRLSVGIGTATTGSITFPKNFTAAPRLLAWFATEGTTADVGLRLSSVSNASFSYARETSGTPGPETLHYVAFAQSMNLTARMTTKATVADTDGDTLADGIEVTTYGSNPSVKDTDADGLADNVEVTNRTMTIPVNGTSKTITFKTSPTSDDTDADGVKDPDELAGILDHRILFYDMSTTTDSTHLRDLSGNGNLGTMTGTASGTVKIGGARDFDGMDDKVAATIPGLSGLGAWSFSLWFKWDNTGGTPQHLIALGQSSDATVYMAKSNRTLLLKATSATGAIVRHVVLASFTNTQATQPHYVAVMFDGTSLRAYVDGTAKGPWTASAARIRSDGVKIGTSTAETGNFFDGKIDEVQAWDRALDNKEAVAYYNVTNAATSFRSRLDFDTRTTAGDLFDFSGTSHTGTATGTSAVEGRVGFARRLAGGTDGIVIASSSGISISSSTGTTVDILVLASFMPSQDASLVARIGSLYLNLSSDGVVRWSLHNVRTVASPLPIPLNRWVRVTATASASSTPTLILYLDGVQVASGSATSFPSNTNSITLGYADGQVHLQATLDEFALFSSVLSSWTIAGLGPAGIKLNPNATDTDGDGLADGQELFVKSVKTPKRYPTQDSSVVVTDKVDLALGAPGWAVRGIDAMVGFTHEDMGQLSAYLYRTSGTSYDKSMTLRLFGNAGEVNNFTSYDLLQKPPISGAWLAVDDFLTGRTWYVSAYDATVGKKGQIEYLQMQVTVHTLPNRADTDSDGLNDSEELNLGADGFTTDPWKADTDGDGVGDALEYAGWSRSGQTFVSNPSGFHTDPTRADTDRDGVADGWDRAPPVDLHMSLELASIHVVGSDDGTSGCYLEPFLVVDVGGETAVSDYACLGSNFWGAFGWWYSFNVPDDMATSTLTITFTAYEYDSNTARDNLALKADGSNVHTYAYAIPDAPNAGVTIFPYESSSVVPRVDYLSVVVYTFAPERYDLYLVVPSDYAGVYNVTANNLTMSRRYVGEPRFVSIVFNGTTTKATILVPRSVFFDTRMYADLQDASKLGQMPYKDPSSGQDKMRGYQNGTGSANSDVLQMAFAFDGLADSYLQTILDLLRQNASGVTNKTYLRWTNADWTTLASPYLLGLPDEAIQAVATKVPSWSLSHPEYLQEAPPPLPWWERLWRGFVEVLDEVLRRIVSGIVWVANLIADFLAALVNFGSWVATTTGAAIASAVEAAGEVLGQFVDWVVGLAVQTFQSAIQGLLLLARAMLEFTIGNIIDLAKLAVGTAEVSIEILVAIATAILNLAQIIALIPMAIRVAEVAIAIATLGVGFVAMKVIGRLTGEFIVRTLSLVALSLVAEYLIAETLESFEWVTTSTVDFFKGIGIGLSVTAGLGKIGLNVYKIVRDRSLLQRTPLWRWFGVGLSITSLMVLLYTALFGVGPDVLFFLDLLAIALGFGGLLIYWTESLNFSNRAMDTVSSMGATVEKVVVYGQLPLAFAAVLVHSATPGYGLNS
jgi:hypothetical protein